MFYGGMEKRVAQILVLLRIDIIALLESSENDDWNDITFTTCCYSKMGRTSRL